MIFLSSVVEIDLLPLNSILPSEYLFFLSMKKVISFVEFFISILESTLAFK